MPEIKNNFTGGKMNKDLDERLVPTGQYKDAMNIQVSTSEGSEVGVIQNILGNERIENPLIVLPVDAGCVGSVADEKNDILYWFVFGKDKDFILRYGAALTTGIEVVFADLNKNCLKFVEGSIITGINIIDDMLFWTDNNSEPKKINVPRSIFGTDQTGTIHTKLVNTDLNISPLGTVIDIKEEHITVIRRSPKNPLTLETFTGRDPSLLYSTKMTITSDPGFGNNNSSFIYNSSNLHDFSNVEVDDIIYLILPVDLNGSTEYTLEWKIGDKIVLKEYDETSPGTFVPPPLPVTDYRLRGVIVDWIDTGAPAPYYPCDENSGYVTPGLDCNRFTNNSTSGNYPTSLPGTWPFNSGSTIHVAIQITAIDGYPPVAPSASPGYVNTLDYVIDLFDETEKLFEFRFPRFSYRYKYEDGEYSCFAPWSKIAFVPGAFDHHPKKGFNLGMTNRLTSLTVNNFVPNDIPQDVVEVDILYKEDASPNIYTVETIKPKDNILTGAVNNNWHLNKYHITSETIHSVLPSNQILRPWDNVPQRALAQDITGNRIVYANYIQNYNLFAGSTSNNYYPDFKKSILQFENVPSNAQKSIKSLREYQLGVTFTDKYGRETPVTTSPAGAFKLDKSYAKSHNRISTGFNGVDYPHNMTAFKFYIKETSGEYYNMAMDRYYDAEDGNVWLAFPSTDRNKVDIDTFLILKKATDSDDAILEPARFKILAIENNAPDYVKTSKTLIEKRSHSVAVSGISDLFGSSMSYAPGVGDDYFQMSYEPFFMSSGANAHEITDGILYVEFTNADNEISNRYKITELACNYDPALNNLSTAKFNVKIEGRFGDDVNFITDDPTGLNSTKINDGTIVQLYKYKVENKPQFDGRFFVKILSDDIFRKYIRKIFDINNDMYKVVAAEKVSFLHHDLHDENTQTYNSTGTTTPQPISVFTLPTKWFPPLGSNIGYNGYAPSRDHFMAWFQDFKWDDDGGVAQWYNTTGNAYTSWDIHATDGYIASAEEYGWHMYYPEAHPRHTGALDNFNVDLPKRTWFIDGGAYHATRFDNHYKTSWDPTLGVLGLDSPIGGASKGLKGELEGVGDGLINDTVNDKWSMDLSFGGIWSHDWDWPPLPATAIGYDDINNFFSIGKHGGNIKHVDEADFASRLVPGARVRWREDPNKTIYTIRSGVEEKNRVRYFSGRGNQIAAPTGSVWSPITQLSDLQDNYLPSSGQPKGLHFEKGFTNPANFTKTWDIEFEPALNWDPAENVNGGTITNGHSITLSMIGSNFTTTNQAYIITDSIVGTCATTGGTYAVVPGMIWTKFNTTVSVTGASGTSPATSTNDTGLLVKKVVPQTSGNYHIYFCGYTKEASSNDFTFATSFNTPNNVVFEQPCLNMWSPTFIENYHWMREKHPGGFAPVSATDRLVESVQYTLEIIEPVEAEEILPDDPAIWETEPKEITDLNIYYEASSAIPLMLSGETTPTAVPVGSTISSTSNVWAAINESIVIGNVTSIGLVDTQIQLNDATDIVVQAIAAGNNTQPLISAWVAANPYAITIMRSDGLEFTTNIVDVNATDPTIVTLDFTNTLYNSSFKLSWYNCYSFGNGVESNRIRDNFNLPYILNGVKASTTLSEPYKRENRKYGLIYSGIYNSISGINNLNQFIQAEKITKDINPTYGSIQKIHARDTDLIALCEDKILKILSNKDAVYNADGNPQLTATQNVLGQTIPFVGEYGISKNPESFASESYRAYFSDKTRGAVLRLSRDGLTAISDHGMKDWFRDHLKLGNKIIGSYDDKKDEYNITLGDDSTPH